MKTQALILIAALTFSLLTHANELICEQSHLSTPGPNLEQIASNLAKIRQQIYKVPDTKEKDRADQEFKTKYAEFEALLGDKEKTKGLFQLAMNALRTASTSKTNPIEKVKERDLREKEQETIDALSAGLKAQFHEIQPGAFLMGKDKVPTEISKPFSMMAIPVTQMFWARIQATRGVVNSAKLNPARFKDGPENTFILLNGIAVHMNPDHPIESVTVYEILEWIETLNKLSNSQDQRVQTMLKELIPDHQAGDMYDLPSEAQWEFVMRNRGQANGKYFDRDDDSEMSQYAWHAGNSDGHTHPVARLLPRIIDGHEFYDLEGNVEETVKDVFDSNLKGGVDPQGLPPGPSRPRTVRGSSWDKGLAEHFTNRRHFSPLIIGTYDRGFRLIRIRP